MWRTRLLKSRDPSPVRCATGGSQNQEDSECQKAAGDGEEILQPLAKSMPQMQSVTACPHQAMYVRAFICGASAEDQRRLMANPISIFIAVLAVASVTLLLFLSRYFLLWVQAYASGSPIRLMSLLMMPLRKVNAGKIVQCKVMAVQAGLPEFSVEAIEAQHLAGGDVLKVTRALIAANRADIQLDWNTATAVDLAGRDILEAVQVSVNPKVIDCPDTRHGRGDALLAIARDGIQLRVRVRVTVRTNLLRLIGGATEATVIARVGESIISAIGSCETHRDALQDPLVITRNVTSKALDSNTAFSIVSIDIADIDVGENIGAKLQTDQAEADIRVARAAAEQRRAEAIARQQEMKTAVAQSRANLVLKEASVPWAMADAIREGWISRHQEPTAGVQSRRNYFDLPLTHNQLRRPADSI